MRCLHPSHPSAAARLALALATLLAACALACATTHAQPAKKTPAKTTAAKRAAPADSAPQLISTTGGRDGDDAVPAKKWPDNAALKKAADAGDPDASYELGNRHLAGSNDLPKNPARALLYFQDAARKGHRDANFRLGKLYADGDQTPRDYEKALAHYTAAARAGHALAQHNLGAMLASGRGVKTDYAEGLAWLILASRHDTEAADGEKKLRNFLASINRPDAIASGETRARELAQELIIAKTAAPTMPPDGMNAPVIKPGPIQMAAPEMPPPSFDTFSLPTMPDPPMPATTGTGARKK